ncbi:SCO family protein [Runella sp.]|uniref:SCO family protein n=1 Tax=Runella sp. TaxID=1960881 RepID=UPI003D0AE68D
MWPTAFLICALSGLLAGCNTSTETSTLALPFYNTPDFTPVFLENSSEIEVKVPHRIRKFSFVNQNNETISEKAIEGKIHIANFFFTSCPSICPKMTNQMKKIQDSYRNNKDVVLLSYSVTPWIDTPERLKEYAQHKGVISGKWHLLTGAKGEIYDLARKSYFAEENIGYTKDSTQFLHTEHFLLVDKSKHIRGIYNGTLELEIQQLIKDIEILSTEK